MSKDSKNLFKYLGIIYLSVLSTYKIPHDSYSISEYIIRPIKFGNGTLFLSGLVPMILFIIGFAGLTKLDRYKNRNRLLMFIVVLIVILPIMDKSLDFFRTQYHQLKGDDIESIDIVDSDISISTTDNKAIIKVDLELIDYSERGNSFTVRMYYPKGIEKSIGKEFIDFDGYYNTSGNGETVALTEYVEIDTNDVNNPHELFSHEWFDQDYKIEIYNENEKVMNIVRGNK